MRQSSSVQWEWRNEYMKLSSDSGGSPKLYDASDWNDQLEIGQKNSQSNLHNEKIQLMNPRPVAHDRMEP
jgi:hypothetical protein